MTQEELDREDQQFKEEYQALKQALDKLIGEDKELKTFVNYVYIENLYDGLLNTKNRRKSLEYRVIFLDYLRFLQREGISEFDSLEKKDRVKRELEFYHSYVSPVRTFISTYSGYEDGGCLLLVTGVLSLSGLFLGWYVFGLWVGLVLLVIGIVLGLLKFYKYKKQGKLYDF